MTTRLAEPLRAGFFAMICLLTVGVAAQQPAHGQKSVPTIKGVPCTPITSVDGRDNFDGYCAVCHGEDARGNGPAAPALRAPVPDLTTMARRRGGKFDRIATERIISGVDKLATPAHGVEDMPIWGEVFRGGDPSENKLRLHNLVLFLEQLQQPGTEPTSR